MRRFVPALFVLLLEPLLAAQCPLTVALRPPPGTSLSTRFAEDVAQFGDLAVVGDSGDGELADFAGAAYVFERQPAGDWIEVQKLLASDGQANHGFGTSVGIVDGWIAVGSPNAGLDGAIYMFQRQGTTWVETQKLEPGSAPSHMGWDLDLSGTTLTATHGRATRYRLEGSIWVVSGHWTDHTDYGPAVSRDGPRVLFGGTTPRLGTWAFPTGSFADGYGQAVSLSGPVVAIAEPRWDSSVLNAGAVHIYEETPTETWNHTATLESPDPAVNGDFGTAVVVDGQRLFIGAPHEQAGRVYVFRRAVAFPVGVTWTLTAVLEPVDPTTYGEFGYSISVQGMRVLVGARGIGGGIPSAAYFFTVNGDGVLLDDDESDPGSRYCFDQPCPCGNDGACTGCINSTGSGALLSATGTASFLADDLRLVATGCAPGNSAIFFAGDTAFVPAVIVKDGLGCAGGVAFRYFGTVIDGQGSVELQNVRSSAPLGFIAPGVTRNFQCWYRDVLCGPPPSACPSPCGGNANLTNAYRVTFTL